MRIFQSPEGAQLCQNQSYETWYTGSECNKNNCVHAHWIPLSRYWEISLPKILTRRIRRRRGEYNKCSTNSQAWDEWQGEEYLFLYIVLISLPVTYISSFKWMSSELLVLCTGRKKTQCQLSSLKNDNSKLWFLWCTLHCDFN